MDKKGKSVKCYVLKECKFRYFFYFNVLNSIFINKNECRILKLIQNKINLLNNSFNDC